MQLYLSVCSTPHPATWEVALACQDRKAIVVLKDPFRERQHDQLRWYLEAHTAKSPFQVGRATETCRELREYGSSLLRMLNLPELFRDMQIPLPSLHIVVDSPRDEAAFNRIIWETLEHPDCHLPITQELVVTRSVRRQISVPLRSLPRADSCYRILFIAARNLVNREEPDHRLVSRSLVSTIASVSRFRAVEFELVRPGTFSALRDAVQSRGSGYYDLIHFDVHGDVVLSEGKKTYYGYYPSALGCLM